MLVVKFIRAAYITGENRVCSLLWHLSLCFYPTPKKGKFSIWHITFWAYVLISSNLVRTWQLCFSGCCRLVAKSYETLCDPMDPSPSGSSVHGIPQARILEWIAMPSSRGSSRPRVWTWVSRTAGRFFYWQPPGKPTSRNNQNALKLIKI